ncbi:hypothetical protein MJL33_31545, partial [Salmonella enterica subsp. enterica serovar Kentucky]|nr:hypothetical protein [Salmonella enterica subsp. enterica serovar Kentucky]
LVILWGHNPTETIFGHTNYFLQKMKQNGTRFIVVDPRYSDTVFSPVNGLSHAGFALTAHFSSAFTAPDSIPPAARIPALVNSFLR